MPTKTLVASAYAAHLARRAADYGVLLDGAVRVDMRRVKARADTVAAQRPRQRREAPARHGRLHRGRGARALRGDAIAFASATQLLTAPRIFINVGGRAAVPRCPGIGEVPFLTNTSMLALDQLPEHLVVIGGSYVGLEFAQMYRRFGAEVTVVEKGAAPDRARGRRHLGSDHATSSSARASPFAPAPSASAWRRTRSGVEVGVDCTDGEPTIAGSHVLLAVGRRPNTDDLGLDAAGVAVDARGYITVDDSLATNVPGIWALGDCNGRGAFTHTAYNDFEIVAANLLDGEQRRVSDRVPAYALYIDPPLGRVGMTEREARASGRPLLVGQRPMSRVGRAVEKGETQGLMKVVVDAETRRILGAAILGTGGDEAIHGVLDIMNAGVPYDLLERAVPIHPTVSELIPTMLGEMQPAR